MSYKNKVLPIILALSMLISMLTGCSTSNQNTQDSRNTTESSTNGIENGEKNVESAEGGDVTTREEYDKGFIELEDKSELEQVSQLVNNLRHSNTYITIQDGPESYETFVYNTAGECMAQGSDNNFVTVFLNNNKSLSYTDVLHAGEDITMLQTVEFATILASNDEATVKKPQEDLENGLKQVRVYLDGWDKVKSLYSIISKEFADKMVANMQQTVKTDNFSVIFDIVYSDQNQLSVTCDLSIDGEIFTSWFFDGYIELYDWKLEDGWYNINISSDAADEEKQAAVSNAEELLDRLIAEMGEMMTTYASDNNINISTPEEEESIDTQTNSTTDNTEENDNSNVESEQSQGE